MAQKCEMRKVEGLGERNGLDDLESKAWMMDRGGRWRRKEGRRDADVEERRYLYHRQSDGVDLWWAHLHRTTVHRAWGSGLRRCLYGPGVTVWRRVYRTIRRARAADWPR
jgi:hypothetical protein